MVGCLLSVCIVSFPNPLILTFSSWRNSWWNSTSLSTVRKPWPWTWCLKLKHLVTWPRPLHNLFWAAMHFSIRGHRPMTDLESIVLAPDQSRANNAVIISKLVLCCLWLWFITQMRVGAIQTLIMVVPLPPWDNRLWCSGSLFYSSFSPRMLHSSYFATSLSSHDSQHIPIYMTSPNSESLMQTDYATRIVPCACFAHMRPVLSCPINLSIKPKSKVYKSKSIF